MKIKIESINKIVLGGLIIGPPLIFSIEINVALLSVVSIFVFLNLKFRYSKTLIITIAPLLTILIIAIFSSFFFESQLFNLIKDFFFLAKPILYILMGYYFIGIIRDKEFLFKLIVYLAVFFALIHLYLTANFLASNDFNVNLVRNYAGRGNTIEMFALIILLSKKGRQLFFFKSKYKRLVTCLLVFSFICYFSRTATVSVILLILAINGYLAITRKGLIYMGGFCIATLLFYVYLFSSDLKRGADGLEGFLYKIKIAPAEIFDSKIDMNDHKDLWDHWRAYEAQKAYEQLKDTPLSSGLLIGKGVGSVVDLEFIAPLDSEGIRYITTLHNGYAYIVFKSGFLGIICFLVFLLVLYAQVYSKTGKLKLRIINNLLSGIAVYYMFTTLIVSGIYNPRDIGGILLGGLLSLKYYYKAQHQKNEYNLEC